MIIKICYKKKQKKKLPNSMKRWRILTDKCNLNFFPNGYYGSEKKDVSEMKNILEMAYYQTVYTR